MLRQLRPDMFVDSIYAIDLERLRRRGVKALILDIDNTLAGWNGPAEPTAVAWLQDVRRQGFSVCLVSNARTERVRRFAEVVKLPAVARARKPTPSGFRRALATLGTTPAETAMIGDQLFTDILGGNFLGLLTVLVVPMGAREFFGTRLSRAAERMVMRNWQSVD